MDNLQYFHIPTIPWCYANRFKPYYKWIIFNMYLIYIRNYMKNKF